MLTLNSVDETDKSDNTFGSLAHKQGSTNPAQVTDSDVIICQSPLAVARLYIN